MKHKRKKAGELSIEAQNKGVDTRDPIELQRGMMQEYCEEVIKCAIDGRKYYKDIFYVVVITKKEKLMQNILRSYYLHRSSCPTPDWDQAVYQFHVDHGLIRLLWVIPAQDIADMLYSNAAQIIDEEKQLRDYVIDFYDGELLRTAKKLNGERPDSPLLIEA